MYMNLKIEMTRQNLSQRQIAFGIGVHPKTLNHKMSGKVEFTRKDMVAIRDLFFPESSIGYLFDMEG